jgi:LacI family transcriptional regulator
MSEDRRRPKVVDVARRAGVSVATVSRVLNGKDTARFSGETADRVWAVARELNYSPSELGRSLRTAKSRAAALLVPDATNGFCADVASSLEPVLREAGMSMLLCNTAEDPERQDEYLEQVVSRGVSAVVLLGAVESPGLLRISRTDTPVVFVNRRPPDPVKGHFVGIDNRSAGAAVAEHFVARGYEDCAVVIGPQRYAASAERLAGFRAKLKEHGIKLPAGRQIESALTSEAGYEQARSLLAAAKPPRAIFCGNDSIAYGVHCAATEAGLHVPRDLAIFGFDDSRLNRWLAPWLSTVHVPVQDFGPAIAEILQDRRKGVAQSPSTVLLPYTLVIRDSA